MLIAVSTTYADVVAFKDGTEINGVIKKVADGMVMVELNGEEKVFDILTVASMDFNTPHLVVGATPSKQLDVHQMVSSLNEINKAEEQIRFKLTQIQGYWGKKDSVVPKEEAGWVAAKEEFRKPLTLYQELLDDLYFQVLAKVDSYNNLMAEARKVYVGVKGPFNIGSSLVPKDLEKLPLKKYVPSTWWDTIYFNGYNMGYEDAVQNMKREGKNSTN